MYKWFDNHKSGWSWGENLIFEAWLFYSVMRYVNFMNVKIQQFYFWGLPACQNFCRLSHLPIKIFVNYRPGSLACMVMHVTWVRTSIATSSKHLIDKFTFDDVSKLSATMAISETASVATPGKPETCNVIACKCHILLFTCILVSNLMQAKFYHWNFQDEFTVAKLIVSHTNDIPQTPVGIRFVWLSPFKGCVPWCACVCVRVCARDAAIVMTYDMSWHKIPWYNMT